MCSNKKEKKHPPIEKMPIFAAIFCIIAITLVVRTTSGLFAYMLVAAFISDPLWQQEVLFSMSLELIAEGASS